MENYDKEVLDLAMEAGRILLDAGAEIFRVEETIQRIAKAFGIEKVQHLCAEYGNFYYSGESGRPDLCQRKTYSYKRSKTSSYSGGKPAFQRDCGGKIFGERSRRKAGGY